MLTGSTDARPVPPRSRAELAAEWDRLAAHREELISEGRDLSYRHILLPSLRALGRDSLGRGRRALDVGCGTGAFVAELAAENPEADFLAIDPSPESIRLARLRRLSAGNLRFSAVAVEEVAARAANLRTFDLVIANMLFQNVSELGPVLKACADLLSPAGALIFALPHPCFWPRYWGYEAEPWFSYGAELWIEAPFRTSLEPESPLRTTHTHRPLAMYVEGFTRANLDLEGFREPMPDAGVEDEYPRAWQFPRFLLGRCRLRRTADEVSRPG
jgi:SAM-dependent methyltransferase